MTNKIKPRHAAAVGLMLAICAGPWFTACTGAMTLEGAREASKERPSFFGDVFFVNGKRAGRANAWGQSALSGGVLKQDSPETALQKKYLEQLYAQADQIFPGKRECPSFRASKGVELYDLSGKLRVVYIYDSPQGRDTCNKHPAGIVVIEEPETAKPIIGRIDLKKFGLRSLQDSYVFGEVLKDYVQKFPVE